MYHNCFYHLLLLLFNLFSSLHLILTPSGGQFQLVFSAADASLISLPLVANRAYQINSPPSLFLPPISYPAGWRRPGWCLPIALCALERTPTWALLCRSDTGWFCRSGRGCRYRSCTWQACRSHNQRPSAPEEPNRYLRRKFTTHFTRMASPHPPIFVHV